MGYWKMYNHSAPIVPPGMHSMFGEIRCLRIEQSAVGEIVEKPLALSSRNRRV